MNTFRVSFVSTVLAAAVLAPTTASAVLPSPDPTRPPADSSRIPASAAPRLVDNPQAFRQDSSVLNRSEQIDRAVGSDSAGSFLAADGSLVVAVTNQADAARAKAAGAAVKLVDDTEAELEAVMSALDAKARQTGAGTVHGWRIDVVSNSVVVTASKGAQDRAGTAFVAFARSFGDEVAVERASAEIAPTMAADQMYGGLEYLQANAGACSTGFNALDSANRHVILTAGHCLNGQTPYRNGYYIGGFRTKNYPTDDFATFWNSYPSYWVPRPWVSMYNGQAMIVKGSWGSPPVGATVCKSGRTTGWTCGTIRALNQTVNYGHGIITGLVRHNACVEPGDSGGSNISAGGYALGLSSGGSFYKTGAYANKCLAKLGQESVSFYQPVVEALNRNGLRLLIG